MMSRTWWMKSMQPVAARFPGLFYRIASATAWVAWRLKRKTRRRLIRNMLPLCDGDLAAARQASKAAMRNVAQYYVDLATLPGRKMSAFEAEHLEVYHGGRLEILAEPGAAVVVSAHTGNAELAIQALTFRGRPFVALVEALEPREWADYLLQLRSSTGGAFHEATFSGMKALLDAMKAGHLAGVMGDRDIQGSGVCVPFFDREVKLPRGPWELARRFDAPLLPVFSARKRRDHFRVYVEEAFRVERTEDGDEDVRRAAARYARLLEAHLRREPGQWTVLEDYWRVHSCG